MKNLQYLLRENVPPLGQIGDVVKVRPGYARNYLVPNKLAIEATAENIRMMERKRVRFAAEEEAREEQITARIGALGNITLSVSEKADESGTLYGSVGAGMIVKLLAKAGVTVEEKDVRLEEPSRAWAPTRSRFTSSASTTPGFRSWSRPPSRPSNESARYEPCTHAGGMGPSSRRSRGGGVSGSGPPMRCSFLWSIARAPGLLFP